MDKEILSRVGGEDIGETPSVSKVALASLVGTTIEWYDFFIYGTAAALIFNQLFFPGFAPLAGTLAAFATFAAGFVARPIGGVVFGHFGDRVGRKSMLVITLLMMGVATFAIGLLPTYAQIGLWAPILLVVLRLLQGIALGGEWGGAALMAVEHAPEGRRGFYGSFPQMGGPAGLLLATLAFSAVTTFLSEAQFAAWGWRVPFLLSVVMVGVGLYVRLKIVESPAFAAVRENQAEARVPVAEVFRSHPTNVFLATGAAFSTNVLFYMAAVFSLSYTTEQLGMQRGTILTAVLVISVVYCLVTPAYGALSDLVGRRKVILSGVVAMGLFAFPFFWLLETRSVPLIWLALLIAFLIHPAMYGPQASLFAGLFGARVRYTGASLGTNLATILVGGTTPFIATALLAWSGGTWPIAVYMIAIAFISGVSVLLVTQTFRTDTSDLTVPSQPTDQRTGQAAEKTP